MGDIQISKQTFDELTLLTVVGYLDAHTYEAMQAALEKLFNSGRAKVAVNLEKVDYISSLGADIFPVAAEKAQQLGGDIVIINPSPNVREVFELLGMAPIMTFATSVNEALEFFRTPTE